MLFSCPVLGRMFKFLFQIFEAKEGDRVIIVFLCFVHFPRSVLRWHGILSAIFSLSALQCRADHEFRPARLVYKQPSTKHLWTPRKPLSRAWLHPNKRQGTASDRDAGTLPTPKSFPVVGIVQSMSGCDAGIRLG